MDRERFEKQLNFILEIDKEKQILRQTHIRGYSRQEDDAEHAWHMAVMAFLLQEYSNEKIDIGRTMLMLLIHDLVAKLSNFSNKATAISTLLAAFL